MFKPAFIVMSSALLFTSGAALAQAPSEFVHDQGTTPAAQSWHSWSVELNPAAMAIGRYSAQLQWLPMQHHALVLNPHYSSVTATVEAQSGGQTLSSYQERFNGIGVELGYRYYTGSKGPNGFFVGPSVLTGTYTASVDGGISRSFYNAGGAIDIGGQGVIGPGIVLGGGFGLQYLKASKEFSDLPLSAAAIAGTGVRPRLLFSVGYAFGADLKPAELSARM